MKSKLDDPGWAGHRHTASHGLRFFLMGTLLVALVGLLARCVMPENYSEWQGRQYNPEWKYLPGPDR